jgi:hypothetical protein
MHHWKGIFKTFVRYIKSSHILKILVGKPKKKCIRLVTANHGGQKNRNGKTNTAVLIYHVFY